MNVRSTTQLPVITPADTVAVGLFEGEGFGHDVGGGLLQGLVDSGEAKSDLKKIALTHAEGKRWVVAGLGKRDEFTPERARVAAAVVVGRCKELGTKSLCWEIPHGCVDSEVAAFVEGTLMANYEFNHFKSKGDEGVSELVVSDNSDVSPAVERGRIVGEAINAARDLQNTPPNFLTPTKLAERAIEIAAEHEALTVEVLDRSGIEAAGMGALAGVAKGTLEEPRLITLRYEPEDATGPLLGFVGKAVTFDAGGISIKPSVGMSEMKFDMSGGAAVLEATAAIAQLGVPIRLISVIGSTENLPSGTAVKPSDVLTAMNGTTIEVINTDAEGRLVLADCLTYAIEQGAERIVDLATLTGAVSIALGNVYAGVFSNDEQLVAEVLEAGRVSGEIVWRMPLHPDYAARIKGQYTDITNAVENRKAGGAIMGAEFLHHFVGDVPWVHVDMANVAADAGRAYAPTGGAGWGVRLLVELAGADAACEQLYAAVQAGAAT